MSMQASDSGHRSRKVVITGAGSGIGRAITQRLLLDGFSCILAGRRQSALEETVAKTGVDSKRAEIVACDLRLPEDRRRLISRSVEASGTLFGLINNAGIGLGNPFLDVPLTYWRHAIEVNLEAAFFLAQEAAEYMRPQSAGRIVNISSVRGFRVRNNVDYGDRAPEVTPGNRGPVRDPAYAASKGGLIQLTKELAAAVGRWGITANSISPGVIPHPDYSDDRQIAKAPDFVEGLPAKWAGVGYEVSPDLLRTLENRIPLGRVGCVQEIAGPVSFLLSDDASYITGENLVVDGGWTIW